MNYLKAIYKSKCEKFEKIMNLTNTSAYNIVDNIMYIMR